MNRYYLRAGEVETTQAKIRRTNLELTKLDKMVVGRQIDSEQELMRILKSLKAYADTSYERNMIKRIQITLDEIHEMHRLENQKRDKIYELNNIYKIKAGLKDLGKFENDHVLIEAIKLEGEVKILRQVIKLRESTIREKVFEIRNSPLVKGFSQLDRVVDPKTGQYVYLEPPKKEKIFQSKDEVFRKR
jgi:hypothetical protein